MALLIMNHENALLQPTLTAKRTLASLFQIPLDWIVMSWSMSGTQGKYGPLVLNTDIIPPPDGRAWYPEARFFSLTDQKRVEIVGRVMSAATKDRAERFEELTAHPHRGN